MTVVIDGTTGIDTIQDGAVTVNKIGTGAVTPVKLSQPLTLATAQNTTSGTSIDFTGIPSWAKRITVMLVGVSTNGSSQLMIQLGISTGIDATGYNGAAQYSTTNTSFTTGFLLADTSSAGPAYSREAMMTLIHFGSNKWCESSIMGVPSGVGAFIGAGSKTLSGTLDRIRLTTVNGTDTFDAGSVNIMYEG